MDSLLHDVRNPLNALSINLDVLTEKLRREQGEIPAAQEKNLKVMREQIFRVDAILKQFSDYLAPRADHGAPQVIDASEIIRQTVHLLGHECRRSMIKVRQMMDPDLRIRGSAASLRFVVLQAVFRGIVRAGNEGELDITFQRDGDRVVLRVKDGTPGGEEPFDNGTIALQSLAAELCGEARIAGGDLQIFFPLV